MEVYSILTISKHPIKIIPSYKNAKKSLSKFSFYELQLYYINFKPNFYG